jgi:hypothetical protein
MERTTVFLDRLTLRRARQLARKEGKSFAAVVREALAAYIAVRTEGGSAARGLPAIAGQFASGHTDTSAEVDSLLWREPHR